MERKFFREDRTLKRTKLVAVFFLFILFTFCLSNGWAQPYPTKSINMVVGWGAGGATDVTIRALSEAAGKILGQPIVVTNKPGGGSAVGLAMLKNEKPDGYTIGNLSAGGILSQYMRKVPYDALTDFTPIMRFADYAFGLVVRTEAPWKTFKELVEYAKANPGKIRYSTSGAGSFHHLVMEAFSRQEGVKWVHIPYKSGHEATTAILGGHVEVEACSSEWKPYVDSGKLRLLATYNPMRLPKYSNVPTWSELGYNIAASSLIGVVGPKGLPRPVVDKLHDAFKQAMDDPAFKKTMDSFDMPIVYRDPDGLLKDMKEIADRWGKLITDLGIRQE
jgi:tripartite-type tricarboxylate transporter receptor subunit TctC